MEELKEPTPIDKTARHQTSYNEVNYERDPSVLTSKLKHTIHFSRYKQQVECLGQLCCQPDELSAPMIYVRKDTHKIVIIDHDTTEDRKVLYRLKGHKHPVTVVKAISKNTLVSADVEGFVFVWDLKKQQILKSFKAHDGRVNAIESRNSETFVTGGDDGRIKFWTLYKADYIDNVVTPDKVLALCLLSFDDVLYCHRSEPSSLKTANNLKLNVYSVNRRCLQHKLVHEYELPKSLISKPLKQIQINPDYDMTLLFADPAGSEVRKATGDRAHPLPQGDHVQLLPTGRLATWRQREKKSELVVYEHPTEMKTIY